MLLSALKSSQALHPDAAAGVGLPARTADGLLGAVADRPPLRRIQRAAAEGVELTFGGQGRRREVPDVLRRHGPLGEVDDADVVGVGGVARVGRVLVRVALDDPALGEELRRLACRAERGVRVQLALEVLLERDEEACPRGPVVGAVGGSQVGVVVDHGPAADPVEAVVRAVLVTVPQRHERADLGALGRGHGVVAVDGSGRQGERHGGGPSRDQCSDGSGNRTTTHG